MLIQNDSKTMPIMLRCEAVVALLVVILLYRQMGHSWLLFALLVLLPDLSMVGYMFGRRSGALCYNVAHSTIIPGLLFAAGLVWASTAASSVALIWLSHIFADRALGYGLKYQTSFSHTHLGVLAWPRRKDADVRAEAQEIHEPSNTHQLANAGFPRSNERKSS